MENPCTRIHVQYGVTRVSVSIIIHKDVIRDTYRTKFEVGIKYTKYEVVEVSLGIGWSMRGAEAAQERCFSVPTTSECPHHSACIHRM